MKVGGAPGGGFTTAGLLESWEAGMPWVWRMDRISDLGRSKPRAFSATLSSW